ncbi:TPA: hypothetical protein PXF07_000868 [Mannheimia haemolytica]|uniref:Lipoprotein n=1 Tax=Mannheimia haemolytica TaxID=75985 RepID=A0A249A0R4_MANHA|nr:hypothetical protein [Mannheimia haemolytica]AWW71350.1 hypothetical protein C4O86_05940 [Pasteurellaceae bacterium 12565]AGK02374.1 hypothetical protein MHH_c19270 [Mannheimia haemolytica M42548]AGQ24816.1 hypothetical protein F382_01875 [Mannheimia haemolytica D153]AGQ37842.1 hypothetical protein J450_01310 [Mannheimia haemolytica D171]AGQ40244.1 hypothetical protein J451_01510 [Mannheimia haemolytica D174]
MKKLSLISIVALSACSIFGPSYSGETTASPLLKLDTERNINLYFQAIHKCTPDKIHTKIINIPSEGNAKELWTATGCNKTQSFIITYRNDGVGGTFINMTTTP